MSSDNNKTKRCSFCGRSEDEVKKLIAGPNVYICDECVEVCEGILADELEPEADDLAEERCTNPQGN